MKDIKNLLKNIEENISLAALTTFRIGGPAKYFYVAKTGEDIKKAVQVAKDLKLPYYIIGNGSNVLASDQGFDGLVIKISNQEINSTGGEITAGAGVMLANLVNEAASAGLSGLEYMAGIPGTVGGAIYGNAGAFGNSIGEKIEKIEVLDPDSSVVKSMDKKECGFGYRDSIFKKNKYIIFNAVFRLEKGDPGKIKKAIVENIKKRAHHPMRHPNAGSIFKNIEISDNEKKIESLIKKYPDLEKFRDTGKIPIGWFVEELGIRGKKIGGAMIAEEHGNFILNTGRAKAIDVITLISLIKQKVRVNFGIQLQEEIQYLGFK